MDDLRELRHRPLVFVDDLDAPRLRADDLHHFERVLRLSIGQAITVGDGAGSWHEAEFAEVPVVTGERRHSSGPSAPIAIAFTPVKGTRPEWVVQKLTELGVDRMIPVLSERSVVRWDDAKSTRQHERMTIAAREAAMQSRRVVLPAIERPLTLSAFLDDHRDAVLADPEGVPLEPTKRTIVIGPEGGFSAGELVDQELVALPGGILRAETAAVVAAAIACGLRSGSLSVGPK